MSNCSSAAVFRNHKMQFDILHDICTDNLHNVINENHLRSRLGFDKSSTKSAQKQFDKKTAKRPIQ